MPIRVVLVLALAAGASLLCPALPARADGPGPYGPPDPESDAPASAPAPASGRAFREVSPRPPRRVTGGPGYVGSDWGLGKPSFYGIGTRPDWGRSSGD